MQDEPIDDIIRAAAESQDPAFDEQAWMAMRQKLDVHLPQKNRKGRYLLLLLLLALGGATAYWALQKGRSANTDGAADAGAAAQKLPMDKPSAPANGNAPATYPTNGTDRPTPPLTDAAVTNAVQAPSNPATTAATQLFAKEKATHHSSSPTPTNTQRLGKGRRRTTIQTVVAEELTDTTAKMDANSDITAGPTDMATPPKEMGTSDVPTNSIHLTAVPIKAATVKDTMAQQASLLKTVAAKDSLATAQTALDKPQPKNKKRLGGNLALLLSAGADMSYVRLSNHGKTTLLYGAGLGYTIGKRWMVRAGVYSVEKIYAASKADYSLPQPAASNPYLYQIDGRCRVLEIPVGLTYAFAGQKQHRWFAGVGLASMLMKTERYDYQYKSATGIQYTRSYGVNNVNKHYFSILSLSAGYQYQVGKRFSLLAEPYIKLPLNGVGLGKVKLQSVGMLVSLAIQPFAGK